MLTDISSFDVTLRNTSSERGPPTRTDPDGAAGFELTAKLFFDDAFSARVFSTGGYASKGAQVVPNASDGIFSQSDGATPLSVTQEGDASRATIPIAIQVS